MRFSAVLMMRLSDIITESTQAPKKSKSQLEEIVIANGGKIFQTHIAAENMICIGDRRQSSILPLTSPMALQPLNISCIQGPSEWHLYRNAENRISSDQVGSLTVWRKAIRMLDIRNISCLLSQSRFILVLLGSVALDVFVLL